MVHQWPKQHFYPRRDDTPTNAARMLAALTLLEDIACIESFLTGVTAAGVYAKADNAAILGALALLPRKAGIALIERIVGATGTTAYVACADLLARAADAAPEHAANLRASAATLVQALPAEAKRSEFWETPKTAADPSLVVDVLTALPAIDAPLADRAVSHILAFPKVYDPDIVLVPAARSLRDLGKTSPAAGRLHAACLAHLQARIAEPLAPPADWRRPSTVGCNCVHCAELSRFLADPGRGTWILRAAQAHRSHVEDTIRKAHCDVDTTTERRGSPHSLICAKNQASYERRAKQRVEDIANLGVLSR